MSLEIFNDQCGKSTVINQLGESKLWKSGNVDVYSIDFNNKPYDLTHYAYRAIVVMIIWYTCIWIYSCTWHIMLTESSWSWSYGIHVYGFTQCLSPMSCVWFPLMAM